MIFTFICICEQTTACRFTLEKVETVALGLRMAERPIGKGSLQSMDY